MTAFGYTLMTEQSAPKDLVSWAVGAEEVGFDFEVCSDHYFPWLAVQGHGPYAWSVLGAVAHATSRVGLMTYVTCPTTAGFAAATQFVREEDVADSIPCGPDLDEIADAVKAYVDAGYTDVAMVQIGGAHQREFLDNVAGPLLEKLRALT